MKTSSCLLASLVLAAACGGGGGKKNPPAVDSAPMIDAPPPCTAPDSYTAVMDLAAFYKADSIVSVTGNQEQWDVIGDLNADASPDWLWIQLFEGPAPDYTVENFPSTPFTIQLTGNELDYLKCSACISLTTDVSAEGEDFDYVDDYMATAGSITITALTPPEGTTPGTITGTLDNVALAHVDISMAGTVPNASGCKSTLPASVPFTAMAMPPMTSRAGLGIRLPIGKRTRDTDASRI